VQPVGLLGGRQDLLDLLEAHVLAGALLEFAVDAFVLLTL
jgi:hypothetical protein